MTNILEVRKLNYKNILKNVDFSIAYGDYVALLGPNGAGKSTLLKIILGILNHKGYVKLFGQDLKAFKSFGRISCVWQNMALDHSYLPLSVYDFISLKKLSYSFLPFLTKAERENLDELLELTNLKDLKNRLISQLSGGQKQKTLIAQALFSKPDFLILDEAHNNLDETFKAVFYNLIKKLNKEKKISILFVTHDFNFIAQDVDYVLCLNSSLLCRHEGKDKMVFAKPDHHKRIYGF